MPGYRTLILAAALLLTGLCPAHADAAANLQARALDAWSKITDYSCKIQSHVVKGSKTEDRSYLMYFKKPTLIRLDVITGTRAGDAGSVAVYTGTGKVAGHQGGVLSGINLELSIDDPKTTSIRGGRITDLPFSKQIGLIQKYQNAKGKLEVGAPTTISGHAATPLTLFSNNPSFIMVNENIAKEVIYLSNATGLPLQWDRYEADGTLVVHITFTDLKVNNGLQEALFNPKAKASQ
ncbi:MAG: DUF1571 domain-containing protein [Armatimonadetes bacterium]|nr:DUF1571 domain-containing protein [Armatimonadota bacterium]